MIKNKKQLNKAFTLIELMVATTLFTIIMTMGVGSLLASADAARSAQKLRVAVDNVNFAMESMTRELRVGTKYNCSLSPSYTEATSDCNFSQGVSAIVFTPQYSSATPPPRVVYKFLEGKLKRCVGDENACSTVVSSEVTIDKLVFQVKGSSVVGDNVQPSVQVLMKGSISLKGVTTPFAIESMASQRSSEK